MKNKMIAFAIFIIIIFSFFVPEWLFKLEDFRIERQICTIARPENKIDVEAEKIYLVRAIHDVSEKYSNLVVGEKEKVYIENNNYVEVAPSSIISKTKIENKDTLEEVKNEILKLESGGGLKNIDLTQDVLDTIYSMEKSYMNEKDEYKIKFYYFKNAKVEIKIENKTGKIVYIIFPKDKLVADIQEVMKNYVKYLDLYIINDWKFENNKLKSEKAQLEVVMVDMKEEYILTIRPVGNNIDYYKTVEKVE